MSCLLSYFSYLLSSICSDVSIIRDSKFILISHLFTGGKKVNYSFNHKRCRSFLVYYSKLNILFTTVTLVLFHFVLTPSGAIFFLRENIMTATTTFLLIHLIYSQHLRGSQTKCIYSFFLSLDIT